MPPYIKTYPNKNLTTIIPKQYHYTLPIKTNKQHLLNKLTNTTYTTLITKITKHHTNPIILITPNIQNALHLHNKINQFTNQIIINLTN